MAISRLSWFFNEVPSDTCPRCRLGSSSPAAAALSRSRSDAGEPVRGGSSRTGEAGGLLSADMPLTSKCRCDVGDEGVDRLLTNASSRFFGDSVPRRREGLAGEPGGVPSPNDAADPDDATDIAETAEADEAIDTDD